MPRTVAPSQLAGAVGHLRVHPTHGKPTEGALVRVYHCTRLTPRELASVRAEGLKLLSPEFAKQRIANAVADGGQLTPEEGALYATSREMYKSNRRGRIWLIGDRSSLARTAGIRWLRLWGGEGINMAWSTRSPESVRLQSVGVPVSSSWAIPSSLAHGTPGWLAAAAERVLAHAGGASLQCEQDIPAAAVEGIAHPGDAFWDKYVGWAPPSPTLDAGHGASKS